ncbi:MAG TPA: hypothetical protein PLX77_07455 [Candidatus Cloacimonadota bacterium]|nr:hypothetical protein [Candidatus Cloacimonadota bacterium]
MPDLSFDDAKRNIHFDLQFGDGLQWIATGLFGLLLVITLTTSIPFITVYFLMLPLYYYVRRHYVTPRRGIAKPRIHPMPKSLFLGTGLAILISLIVVFGSMWIANNNYKGTPMLIWSVAMVLLTAGMWTYYV